MLEEPMPTVDATVRFQVVLSTITTERKAGRAWIQMGFERTLKSTLLGSCRAQSLSNGLMNIHLANARFVQECCIVALAMPVPDADPC